MSDLNSSGQYDSRDVHPMTVGADRIIFTTRIVYLHVPMPYR
jgi:hypothetical protein